MIEWGTPPPPPLKIGTRTIIAGSRNVHDPKHLHAALASCGWVPTTVISGTAQGADMLGEQWARENNIPLRRFPADWNQYGRSAGHRRNVEMAENADALIALWQGESRGTADMIRVARWKGLRVFVQIVP